MQRPERPLPTGHFVGRGLLYLYLEAGTWMPAILVGLGPRLQFVTGLPNSPKTKANGVILVRGPWNETSGSSDLPFTLNRLMSFSGVFKLWGMYASVRLSFTFTY